MAEEELSAEAMIAEVTKDASGESAEAPSQSQEKTPETPAQQMFKYKTSFGKEVEEPLDMVLKRAGYGYHYAQDKHKLEQDRQAWDKERQTVQERIKALERWEAYDKYAKDNPDWATHVESSWNTRGQLQQAQPQQDPYSDRFKKYDETLEQLKGFMSEQVSERQKAQYQREDSELAKEIEQVGKDYGVDLSQANENGESLEWQIMKHMQKLDLPGKPGQFRAAFLDHYHPNLMGRAKETALEQTSKEKVELKKAGILDISRTPKGQNPSKGYKPGMSYEDLSNQVLAEVRAKA